MHPWDQATAGRSAPLAVVDLDAFEANHDDLVRRAGSKPIRVASKSVRVRSLVTAALTRSRAGVGPGFHGHHGVCRSRGPVAR
ncbi:hypothetical protein [Nostocoides vanveenii]|uniref:Alanine racemase N-terminal domain-containing protein n=1 Tax=Nostocoides vanveenii TaxID=330835 RepID=A0ABN2KRE8_9MICO